MTHETKVQSKNISSSVFFKIKNTGLAILEKLQFSVILQAIRRDFQTTSSTCNKTFCQKIQAMVVVWTEETRTSWLPKRRRKTFSSS